MFRTRQIEAVYCLWAFESAFILLYWIVVPKMDGALPHYALVEPELEKRRRCTRAVCTYRPKVTGPENDKRAVT